MTEPTEAVGIHAHPKYKTGKRAPVDKPAIKFKSIRTRRKIVGPIVPAAVDDTAGVKFGLDGNDRYGVCVPTGFDNFRRMTSKLLTGAQVSATQDQIFTWYREQNPTFNAATGAGDGGMIIQDFLAARAKAGDILAFASVDMTDEAEVREAVWLFLGLIFGVNLQTAQQTQTDATPPRWTYQNSAEWGGHCIMVPAFELDMEDCITWLMRVQMAASFLKNQRDEAWVVITRDHYNHPAFREGIDINKLGSEYERLTGRTFPGASPVPNPTPPTPAPVPAVDIQDKALWNVASDWVDNHRHSGEARDVSNALRAWAIAKGLLLP